MNVPAQELSQRLKFRAIEECAVCGGSNFEAAYERRFLDRDFFWTRCSGCRLLFQNPQLEPASLDAIYNSDLYWQEDKKSDDGRRMGYKDYEEGDVYRLLLGDQRFKLVDDKLAPQSHVLDIGCATGFFLKNAKDRGHTGVGVELSEEMSRYGHEAYGVDILVGDIETVDLAPGSFDLVTFWGCDSNFAAPRQTFQKAYELLKPGGHLYFNFWDFDHILRPLLLGDNKILYNSLFCFNSHNMGMLLERTGFETVWKRGEWRKVTLDLILAWSGHIRLLTLLRKLRLSEFPVWAPALTGYLVLARKV